MESKVLPNDVMLEMVGTFLAEGKSVRMTPKGCSMLPFIRGNRDNVILAKPSRALETGDIVLAKVRENYVMHRIWALDGDRIILMGDGNLKRRERCASKDVIGIVTEIVKPDGRRVRPGKGRFWRAMLPFRRWILAILRRTVYRKDNQYP